MSRSTSLLHACALLAAAALAAPLHAADASAPTAAKPAAMQIKIGFDENGKMSRETFIAANAGEDEAAKAKLGQAFNQLDANRDGFLEMSELQRLQRGPAANAAPDDEPEANPPMPSVSGTDSGAGGGYAVVISSTTAAKPEWKSVADALVKKHDAKLVVYEGSVVNCLPELAKLHPRFTAFVTRPEVLGRIFVARVHRLTRQLNDDPYTDTVWGIVSAATPEAALRMANATGPKTVHSAMSLTGIRNELFDEVYTISDGKKGDWLWKHGGKTETGNAGADTDRVREFVGKFKAIQPEAIVGSGHATERNLEMCFSKGNTEGGGGKWYGLAEWRTARETRVPIEPDGKARVFVGAGNCLIGNFQKRADSMAPTLISGYGVTQFVGYTVPTWYGKGGWGTLGLWQSLPGSCSLAEAWFFNNQLITNELLMRFPQSAARTLPISERGHGLDERQVFSSGVKNQDEAGMLWDRDVVAFYGDPALRVLLDGAKQPAGITCGLKENGGSFSFNVAVGAACTTKEGAVCFLFPKRIPGKLEIVSGGDYQPILTENFIIVQKPDYAPGKTCSVVFRPAKP